MMEMIGWLFGCFGARRKPRKHSPPPSIPIQSPAHEGPSSDHLLKGRQVLPASLGRAASTDSWALVPPPVGNTAALPRRPLLQQEPNSTAQQTGTNLETLKVPEADPSDPWSHLDDLEEELDNLRKQIDRESEDAKKVRDEVSFLKSCGTLLQTPPELRTRNRDPEGQNAPESIQTSWHSWLLPSSSPSATAKLYRKVSENEDLQASSCAPTPAKECHGLLHGVQTPVLKGLLRRRQNSREIAKHIEEGELLLGESPQKAVQFNGITESASSSKASDTRNLSRRRDACFRTEAQSMTDSQIEVDTNNLRKKRRLQSALSGEKSHNSNQSARNAKAESRVASSSPNQKQFKNLPAPHPVAYTENKEPPPNCGSKDDKLSPILESGVSEGEAGAIEEVSSGDDPATHSYSSEEGCDLVLDHSEFDFKDLSVASSSEDSNASTRSPVYGGIPGHESDSEHDFLPVEEVRHGRTDSMESLTMHHAHLGHVQDPISFVQRTPLKLSESLPTPESLIGKTMAGKHFRLRSRPASSVLMPVENVSQWMQLKERDDNAVARSNFYKASPARKILVSAALDLRNEGWDENHCTRTDCIRVDTSFSHWLKPTSPQTLATMKSKANIGAGSCSPVSQLGTYTPPALMPGERSSADGITHAGSVNGWDGKGIPNTTTKYKEDQKVNWHTTPFEVRLERALDKQGVILQKKLFGAPCPGNTA